MENLKKKSPFKIRNVRLFIAFRVTFNTRFYYPVFAILFLDFGLTLEQFALLNAAWAAAIVLLEVPSGAMADVVGRRNLLVFSGLLMVLEMALLCFVPRGNATLLFVFFLCNRILSGAAEAAASGADEAIAYDTLTEQGMADAWPRVLEREMVVKSMAYMAAMSVGAAVYDPSLMQWVATRLGLNIRVTQEITLRIPLFLTLIMAVLTLLIALRMREMDSVPDGACRSEKGCAKSITQAVKLTAAAGRWLLYTPFALVVILAGLVFDSTVRMIVTLGSQYYRLIHLPEASFGVIASLMSILGLFIPRVCHKLVERHSPIFNLTVMSVVTLLGLAGMVLMLPIIGILPMALIFCVMYMNSFFQSHYLNRVAGSEQRATVLSFKGLSFNLAYGIIGVLYSVLIASLRDHEALIRPLVTGDELESQVFVKSLYAFPWYFVLFLSGILIFGGLKLKNRNEYRRPG
ncbi:MAG: MFS transporter [Desulfatiglandales bacterium]